MIRVICYLLTRHFFILHDDMDLKMCALCHTVADQTRIT
jgi:hypothetical protein